MENNLLKLSFLHQLKARVDYLKNISHQKIPVQIPSIDDSYVTTAMPEALLACLCYIDGCGYWLYGKGKGSKKNFIKILIVRHK